mgnify:CR=1 FL=1
MSSTDTPNATAGVITVPMSMMIPIHPIAPNTTTTGIKLGSSRMTPEENDRCTRMIVATIRTRSVTKPKISPSSSEFWAL